MAWWAWLIIWTVLVLGFIGMLVWFGFRLFRKAMAALHAVEELGEKVAKLTENVEELTVERPESAIELGYAEVSRRHDLHIRRRAKLREARREARLARGRLLISPPTIPTLRK
jgi:hypothetical protein